MSRNIDEDSAGSQDIKEVRAIMSLAYNQVFNPMSDFTRYRR